MVLERLVPQRTARRLILAAALATSLTTFFYSWWWCYAHHGYLFGFGLGWLPSLISGSAIFAFATGLASAIYFALAPLYRALLGLPKPIGYIGSAILTGILTFLVGLAIAQFPQAVENPALEPGPLSPAQEGQPTPVIEPGADYAGPEDPA